MQSDSYDHLSEEELADLARLADGTLPPERRAEVEMRLADSPELSRAFATQAVALDALQQANRDTGAPAQLRAQLERKQTRGARRSPRARSWRGLAAAGAAAAVALALVLPGVLSSSLSVPQVAAFGEKPATQDAPAAVPGRPQLLQAKVDDVSFPNYAKKFGWSATGRRDDKSSGRHATTLFYRSGDASVAYTVVSGRALDRPSGGRVTTVRQVDYVIFQHDGRTVVTWQRGGQTCVLSARGVPAGKLVELASWRGKGAIRF